MEEEIWYAEKEMDAVVENGRQRSVEIHFEVIKKLQSYKVIDIDYVKHQQVQMVAKYFIFYVNKILITHPNILNDSDICV